MPGSTTPKVTLMLLNVSFKVCFQIKTVLDASTYIFGHWSTLTKQTYFFRHNKHILRWLWFEVFLGDLSLNNFDRPGKLEMQVSRGVNHAVAKEHIEWLECLEMFGDVWNIFCLMFLLMAWLKSFSRQTVVNNAPFVSAFLCLCVCKTGMESSWMIPIQGPQKETETG